MDAATGDGQGILAVWNDCAPGHEAEYEDWYRHEHLPERLGVPGFEAGWRYRTVGAGPAYFTYYETRSPAVLTSPAYRERLDHPTPLTRRIMSGVFLDASRTVCARALRIGALRGAYAVTARLAAGAPAGLEDALRDLATTPGVERAELWRRAGEGDDASAEQAIRGPDQTITACLVLHALEEADARGAAAALAARVGGAAVGIHRFLCGLLAPDLA